MRKSIAMAIAAGVMAGVGPMTSAVAADNAFLDSDPRPGSAVELEPSRVTIAFDQDVPVESTTIVVRNDQGKIITSRDQHVEANNIYANLPYPLPPGVYQVDYRALDDGVPFGGSFEFAWGTDQEAVGLSQWRSASKIPPILALPGDDELRAAEEEKESDRATAEPTPTATAATQTAQDASTDASDSSGFTWWWSLIPLALVLGGVVWWFATRRRVSN